MIKHSILNPGLTEFGALKQSLHQKYESLFPPSLAEFGDFTYGTPQVLSWGEPSRLIVGKFCSIADHVTIMLGGEHNVDWVTTYPFNALLRSFSNIQGHPKTKGDVVVGNDVWIGDGAKILSGVHIGDGCVIGGNALVTKNMPPYSICGGNPAKVIKYRFEPEIIAKLLEIKWWDWAPNLIYQAVPYLQSNEIKGLFEFYETTVVN